MRYHSFSHYSTHMVSISFFSSSSALSLIFSIPLHMEEDLGMALVPN